MANNKETNRALNLFNKHAKIIGRCRKHKIRRQTLESASEDGTIEITNVQMKNEGKKTAPKRQDVGRQAQTLLLPEIKKKSAMLMLSDEAIAEVLGVEIR